MAAGDFLRRSKMRKLISGILLVVMAMSFTGCQPVQKEVKPAMYIERAQLTEEEQNITELLDADAQIYDFVLDETVQTIQINTYELKDGKWELISGGGGQAFQDTTGRLALEFDNLAEGLSTAIQSENSAGGSKYETELEEEKEGMTRGSTALFETKEIIYEQEIPLVIQVCTSKDIIHSHTVDYYFTPEQYGLQGYEHVYAITVLFSQKTISELEKDGY